MKPALLLLLALFLPSKAAAVDPIKIAYPSTSFTTLPIVAAMKHGHFLKEDIKGRVDLYAA